MRYGYKITFCCLHLLALGVLFSILIPNKCAAKLEKDDILTYTNFFPDNNIKLNGIKIQPASTLNRNKQMNATRCERLSMANTGIRGMNLLEYYESKKNQAA